MPTPDPTPENLEKAQLLMKIAEAEASLGMNNDATLFAISDALCDDRSENANPFVPWSDPQIPFECDCGAIIYSDSIHEH